jgi:hypothetical protein
MVTLNAFTILAFLCLAYLGIAGRDGRYLYPLSFLLGIGFLNSPTFVLMIPIYAVACAQFVSWKRAPGMLGLFALGLLPLLYIPLASTQNPPINWGYARTLEGFLRQITRGQYERLTFVGVFNPSAGFLDQMAAYARLLAWQFSGPVLILSIAAPTLLKAREQRVWLLLIFLTCLLYSIALTIGMNPDADIQTLFIGRVQWIPSYSLMAILIGFGLIGLLDFASRRSRSVFYLACLTAILLSFAPLTANLDPEFVKYFGGSEQGWLGEYK